MLLWINTSNTGCLYFDEIICLFLFWWILLEKGFQSFLIVMFLCKICTISQWNSYYKRKIESFSKLWMQIPHWHDSKTERNSTNISESERQHRWTRFQNVTEMCWFFHASCLLYCTKRSFTCRSELTVSGASLSCSTKPCTYQKPTGKEAFSPISPQLPPLIRWSIINTPINFLNK